MHDNSEVEVGLWSGSGKGTEILRGISAGEATASEEEILKDPEVKLVAGAAVTSERCALGLRVMAAGKDYFTDKAPLTTLEQLEEREYRAASSIPAASRNPGSYKRHPASASRS